MNPVQLGRFTAQTDRPFVLLLIGMRINHLLTFSKWLPIIWAMRSMMRMLFRHPEKGFLGGHTLFHRRGVTVIQYWRSFEDVEKFARSPSEPHLDVWKKFNQAIGSDGSVGIWHETYLIEPNRCESVYRNMPVHGLALATKHVPATGCRETARRRLGGDNEAAIPSPPTPFAN